MLASAEIFTLSTRSFAPTGAMVQGRADHAVTALADGRALITGGLVLDGAGPATIDVATTEIWDPASGAFSAGPSGTVMIGGGRGPGGDPLASVELYDPVANTFTPLPNLPATTYDAPAAFVQGPGPG